MCQNGGPRARNKLNETDIPAFPEAMHQALAPYLLFFQPEIFQGWAPWPIPSIFPKHLWSVEARTHPQAAFLHILNFAKF